MARVMVIDDEVVPQQSIAGACRDCGHLVFPFNIPLQAVDAIDGIKPQAILVRTCNHPFELIRTLRKNVGVPIIYVTDLLSSEEGSKGINAMKAGASNYILTPCKTTQFGLTIQLELDAMALMNAEVPFVDPSASTVNLDEAVVEPPPSLGLTKEQQGRLERASRKGRHVTFKVKGEPGKWKRIGLVEDEVYIIIGEYKHLIQKIKFEDGVSWDKSSVGYRTGYYTFQADKKAIKWGQYTQFLTEKEYRELLGKAKEKGWSIF